MPQKVCIVALLVVGVLVLDYVRIVAELDVLDVAVDVVDVTMDVLVLAEKVAVGNVKICVGMFVLEAVWLGVLMRVVVAWQVVVVLDVNLVAVIIVRVVGEPAERDVRKDA